MLIAQKKAWNSQKKQLGTQLVLKKKTAARSGKTTKADLRGWASKKYHD